MKSMRRFDRAIALSAALVILLGNLATLHADSLASIFTNVQATARLENLPSIIIFRCHGLGYGDLSCYGQTNYVTPNIDKLAAQGMRFTGYHPESPDFSTALAALMTGKDSASAPNYMTLAARLHDMGYHTGLIGEWTLGDRPQNQGFDDFAGFIDDESGRNYFADHVWRFSHHMIYTNGAMADYFGNEEIYDNIGGKKGRYLPEVFANAVVNFITINHATTFNRRQPFFLIVDYPAPRSASANADQFPVPSDAPYTDEPWPQAAKDRAALMTRIDGTVGRLLETFPTLKMTNNFILFFTSSAPPEKFASRRMDFLKPNGTFDWNDASTPAPMIAYGPQWIPPGRVCDTNWTGVDLAATTMQLAGVRRPPDMPGHSIVPTLTGRATVKSTPPTH